MIYVYTVPKCKFCNETKEYFNSRNIEYENVDMSVGGNKELQARKKQFKELGIKEYPVIIIKDDDCGGEMILPGFDKTVLDNVLEKK